MYLLFSGGYSSGGCDLNRNGHHFTPVLPLVEAGDIVRSVFFALPEKFLSCSIRPLTSSSKCRPLAMSFGADIHIPALTSRDDSLHSDLVPSEVSKSHALPVL